MIAAAALMLVGLSMAEPATPALRLEPRWAVAKQTQPIALSYQREPGQMTASSARADFTLDPSTTLFMQARKQKQETQWDSPKGLGKWGNRAVSVGMNLHW